MELILRQDPVGQHMLTVEFCVARRHSTDETMITFNDLVDEPFGAVDENLSLADDGAVIRFVDDHDYSVCFSRIAGRSSQPNIVRRCSIGGCASVRMSM